MRKQLPAAAVALAALTALAGCGGPSAALGTGAVKAAPAGPAAASAPAGPASPVAHREPRRLPGLGPRTLAEVPADARQAVVVTGRGRNSSDADVVVYERTADGWQAGATWAAHNAKDGWTDRHHVDDLRSPIGVYGLTDAGGSLPDPGSKLPYTWSRSAFSIGGVGFEGEPLAGSFDYVVAINYNRKAGTPPYDWTRPEGSYKGGGIWFHVDHGGPTHACVSLSQSHMKTLLHTLDPSLHPVVVMGDAASLER
jgi:L,D-peptidoglycan transpeptidase YkuD (ErfK/YbiS/YcfS/YnhG family)